MADIPRRNEYGFTFIELVMIITIVGIFSFTAIQKFDFDEFSPETAATQIEAYLRYSQVKAMSQHAQVSVSFNSDVKGWYFTILGENHYIPGNVSLSYSPISFNSLGEAVNAGIITIGGISITVEPTTGKVKRI
ncbi:MAG: Tfp pilus assembly protein FimT/FimU [bacterium]